METGKKEVFAAVVLAAGRGKRMESSVHKQYLLLHEKPVLYYALKAFEESPVQEIVLVVGKGEIEYCQKEIVEKYGFQKISHIIEGGAERYHSVYCGLKAIKGADYVLIHDGARPFITEEILERGMFGVQETGACVVGMPSKDTVKVADEADFVSETPDRKRVWTVQTPQIFSYDLIKKAHESIRKKDMTAITDDAMVVEQESGVQVRLVEGSYQNIKITTPEDLDVAEVFLKKIEKM